MRSRNTHSCEHTTCDTRLVTGADKVDRDGAAQPTCCGALPPPAPSSVEAPSRLMMIMLMVKQTGGGDGGANGQVPMAPGVVGTEMQGGDLPSPAAWSAPNSHSHLPTCWRQFKTCL